MTIFSKRFDDIDVDDIQKVCDEATYENQLLEFKRELQGERGRPDPWATGGDFTAHARDRLFREIVAFANAQGGTLILGIEETKGNPPCASKIMPIPRIYDLASRMENAARACIEPVIPGLHIRGIATETTGHGVLILRVAPSPFGPYRVAGDGHAFIRRGASSVQMTMREIQDLTLDLARGADRLEALFVERAAGFQDWLSHVTGERAACRITALPLGAFPGLPRFSPGLESKFPMKPEYRFADGGGEFRVRGPGFHDTRPIVRGVRRFDSEDDTRVDILESGLIDFWSRHEPRLTTSYPQESIHFYATWLMGDYLHVVDLIDRARSLAGVPDWEFAIEFALESVCAKPPKVIKITRPMHTSAIELPVTFPRIPYRTRSEREYIINLFLDDLGDAAGDCRNSDNIPPVRILD